jgi:ATP-binding cassette subfamily C protein
VLLFVFARLMPRLTGLYEKVQSLSALVPAFTAVSDLEARSAAAARPIVTAPQPVTFVRDIELRDVEFRYGDAERVAAVTEVNLTMRAGTTTAIVGPSGAGKSTIADLLMGLLVPTRGQVLVDGQPLDATRVDAWRRHIGYVPQDTFLFPDSVRANLQWARSDATEQELWRALRLAAAEEFVLSLPAGLDTILGDRGVLVSGGERQRLSLARALVRDPRVLILDEATSSLDSENESRIQDAIDSLQHTMTIVIITHRLSTIRHADLVHVLERGRLVQSGTWEELAERRTGRFYELLSAQGLADDRTARRSQRLLTIDQ